MMIRGLALKYNPCNLIYLMNGYQNFTFGKPQEELS